MTQPNSTLRLSTSLRFTRRAQARRKINAVRQNREPYERQILLLTQSLDAVVAACEDTETPQNPDSTYKQGYLDALADIERTATDALLGNTVTVTHQLDEDPDEE